MRVEVQGLGLEVADEGTGPPVVFLHGWPDSGRLWRHQVAALLDAGFRTIVPDLRGFGASDKPADVGAYALTTVVGDVVALLDHLGVERAHVVGHDWGAALAWLMAASAAPDRVDHLAVLSVGHPAALRAAGLAQREKFWYQLLFQFEGVAERWLTIDGWRNFREWAHHPDHDAVVADLGREGALTASLAWYRANSRPEALLQPPRTHAAVRAPTLGIWSSGDMALVEQQMIDSAERVGAWRYERLDGPGHWMQLEAPNDVNALLLGFLPAP